MSKRGFFTYFSGLEVGPPGGGIGKNVENKKGFFTFFSIADSVYLLFKIGEFPVRQAAVHT